MNVRFGIIGLGSIASRFASVLNTVEGVELVSVASRDKVKAETFAIKFGAKKAYNSYVDLVNDTEVDVVYVALTHNFHFEAIKLCLNNKKGVLCEKPLAINKKDADELEALSKKLNVLLMEAMWTRFIPAFKKAKEWVKSGRIGVDEFVTMNMSFDSSQVL
jgi:predicted dehydrogenase